MDDWTMRDDRNSSSDHIGNRSKKPFSTLMNGNKDMSCFKTKTQAAEKLNYSSFNDGGSGSKDNGNASIGSS